MKAVIWLFFFFFFFCFFTIWRNLQVINVGVASERIIFSNLNTQEGVLLNYPKLSRPVYKETIETVWENSAIRHKAERVKSELSVVVLHICFTKSSKIAVNLITSFKLQYIVWRLLQKENKTEKAAVVDGLSGRFLNK